MVTTKTTMLPRVIEAIEGIELENISEDRKAILQPLMDYIQQKKDNNKAIRLNFICTHNSRRSHLSQIWAQAMAHYYNMNNVSSYSGGTEATALYPMVAQTLAKQGFLIETLSEGNNPVYSIKYSVNELPVIGFSKTYDDGFNPQSGFAAIMTCSQADGGCPFIAGAEKRVPITFEDPKAFDNTPQQEEKYLERSVQIASEMKYIFSNIK
nr:protein-tyrosine-phosphatase [Mangrovimonas aestuarii]